MRKLDVVSAVTVSMMVALVSACAEPKPTPTRAPAASKAQELVLTLTPRDISVKGDTVLYEPHRATKRSTYHTWRFDKAAFVKAVGTVSPKAPVTLKVRVLKVDRRQHVPKDPMVSSPSGGFTYVTHHCKILGVVK